MKRLPLILLSLLAVAAGIVAAAPPPDLTGSGLTVLTDAQGADQRHYVTYRTAANVQTPTTLPATPGYETWAPLAPVAGARYAVTLRELVPPPAPAPAGTPVTPAVKPAATQPARTASRQVALLNHTADQTIRDVYVKGQVSNIVVQNVVGNLLIDNVVSVDACGPGQFDCQGAYIDNVQGATTIRNSLFAYNGRPRNPPGWTPTQYYHHVYFNNTTAKAGKLVITGCIFALSGADAIETRTLAGTEVSGCVFLDCGLALQCVMGGAKIHDCLIYGGNYFWDGGGWTGGTAIKSYWPLVCNNNLVVTRPHQGDVPQNAAHPAKQAYPQMGINLGGKWVHDNPSWASPAGYPAVAAYMSGAGNRISPDWPGGAWYSSGTQEKATKTMAGWGTAPGSIDYDYRPALDAIEAGTLAVPDGITRIKADINGRLK